jgi:hypothetical protein
VLYAYRLVWSGAGSISYTTAANFWLEKEMIVSLAQVSTKNEGGKRRRKRERQW